MNRALIERELIRDEGKRLKIYPDSEGIPTIGIGRNLRDRGLSEVEVAFLFVNDIDRVEADLDRELPWWRTLDEVRQRVLFNMAFNLGADSRVPGQDRLLKFKNTLALIEQGAYAKAAKAMLKSKWAKQVGPRAVRLSQQMENGV